jgi:diadenosine tetraphosphate (Ap4A) HIT family hydrolase
LGVVSFTLDPRLAADAIELGDLALSRLLLMNDARYLWLVLVPGRANLRELIDLDAAERAILMEEIATVSQTLTNVPGVEKLNVGALGNIVDQLHIHVVARSRADAAWPGPVWGFGAARRYTAQEADKIVRDLRQRLI